MAYRSRLEISISPNGEQHLSILGSRSDQHIPALEDDLPKAFKGADDSEDDE